MCDLWAAATHVKVVLRPTSTGNGGRFVTICGVWTMLEWSVGNLDLVLRHRLQVAPILAKDLAVSSSTMFNVTAARPPCPPALTAELGFITVSTKKTWVWCVLQVRKKTLQFQVRCWKYIDWEIGKRGRKIRNWLKSDRDVKSIENKTG